MKQEPNASGPSKAAESEVGPIESLLDFLNPVKKLFQKARNFRLVKNPLQQDLGLKVRKGESNRLREVWEQLVKVSRRKGWTSRVHKCPFEDIFDNKGWKLV